MLNKRRASVIAILASFILAITPMIFLAQGQIAAARAEKLVEITEKAAQEVQRLIDTVNANEYYLEQIQIAGFTGQFMGNVTLYETEGLATLASAQETLANSGYEEAVNYGIEALRVFRQVYISLQFVLEEVDLLKGNLFENQRLLEVITRELQRIDHLREILTAETPQEIVYLLDGAGELLNETGRLLLDGDETAARSAFLEAKQSIFQVYQYLKAQAEESNGWRLSNYCEGTQQRIQERFRYGKDQGVDFTGVLQSFGYQSENQFMEALQSMVQKAQSEQDLDNAIQDCEIISQMVQEMEQALNQEINRHHGQNKFGALAAPMAVKSANKNDKLAS